MLKEKIREDLKKALMKGQELELSVLRMLLATITSKEKEKRYRLSREKTQLNSTELEKESQLTDEEIVKALSREIKKRQEASIIFSRGDRQDLAEKEKKEVEILQKYLS